MTLDTSAIEAAAAGFPKRIRGAIRDALNAVAAASVEPARESFRAAHTVRGTWEIRSIRRTYADPRSLSVRVGSMHGYIGPHLEGGEREGDSWVPAVGSGRPRTRKETRTTRSRWPSAMMARSRAFMMRRRDGSEAIVERVGRGRASRLRTLYTHARRVEIEARWALRETVHRAVSQTWGPAMKVALEAALARRR